MALFHNKTMKKKPLSRVLPLLVLTAALATGGMALYLINPIALGGGSSNFTLTLSHKKNLSFPSVSGKGYAAYPDTALASGDTSYPVYFGLANCYTTSASDTWGRAETGAYGSQTPYLANLTPFNGLVSLKLDVVFALAPLESISKAVGLPTVTFSKTSDYATTVSGSGSFGAASSWTGALSSQTDGAAYSGTFSVPTKGTYDYVKVTFSEDAWIISMVYSYSCAEAVVAPTSTSSDNGGGATAETSGTAGSGLVVTSLPTTSRSSYPSL